MLFMNRKDVLHISLFALVVLTMPIWLSPLGAAYPNLLQKFMIYGVFAVGFNILLGMTGYLSFGHAAFLGAGSYAAVWSFKLLSMDGAIALVLSVVTAAVFALVIGFISLRRSGIYFSILTLAFAEMSYKLAYSVLTPITNGETGLQLALSDPRLIDRLFGPAGDGLPSPRFLGLPMEGFTGFYVCAVLLILAYFLAMRIAGSPFGMMLRAIKSNQTRMNYTGFSTRPYTLAAFVISGMYAGLAGSMLAIVDPLAGAERMQWTASGEVVLMTILGGVGTLLGPVLGAWILKYFENIFSAFNDHLLAQAFSALPDPLRDVAVFVSGRFVGEGWNLTLGLLFMIVVVFLPGGLMEGLRRLGALVRRHDGRRRKKNGAEAQMRPADEPQAAQ